MLDVVGIEVDESLLNGWRSRLARAQSYLKWPALQARERRHAGGVSLAVAAPLDQLFLATEVNEWAVCAALYAKDGTRWHNLQALLVAAAFENAPEGKPPSADTLPVLEEHAALERFSRLQILESNEALRNLYAAAQARDIAWTVDDSSLTLGSGGGARTFSLEALPTEESVPWGQIHNVPTVLVTGSNGKTTTVRLLAAFARAQGLRAAYNCTDGVFLDDEQLAQGDYSGPEGSRRVVREQRAQVAIVETARGGILRRGIAVSRADTSVVTNISQDHFGEYGIYDLDGLAEVKLAIAGVLSREGLLVLNAQDPLLRAQAGLLEHRFRRPFRMGWFQAADASTRNLPTAAASSEVRAGHLYLRLGNAEHDLGPISAMPLTVDGVAQYNVANIAGAVLAAASIGIGIDPIRRVLTRFGAGSLDNPGRLMRFRTNGATVLVDYAHNADGLKSFLQVAQHLRNQGRLAVLLGHAGNRSDADIRELAHVAMQFTPDLVVVKENEAHLRGRAAGEIPGIIREELTRLGLSDSAFKAGDTEVDAAKVALDWARPGDVLALPLHSLKARNEIVNLLSKLQPNA